MKINSRLIVLAIVLACVAALGVSQGAWAGPLMQGTVPSCPTTQSGSGTLSTCNVTGSGNGNYTITEVPLSEGEYPMVPGAKNFGPAVNLTSEKILVEICFPDPTGVGNIFHWMTAADWTTYFGASQDAMWVYWPTYHKAAEGLTCTQTWIGGIYTIEY